MLKSISSFSQESVGNQAPNHTEGLVVTTDPTQEPIEEIDMAASHENFVR